MPVEGQNSHHAGSFEITPKDFKTFIGRHQKFIYVLDLVPEEEELIRGSYVMVSPEGSFFDSSKGYHQYSRPILEVGVKVALAEVNVSPEKFEKRGGNYKF
jgi:radical S-adenosyl methionine domain-containing protein 2